MPLLENWRRDRNKYASEVWLDCYQEEDGATAGKLETISEMLWQGIKRLDNNRLKSILFQKNYFEREFN